MDNLTLNDLISLLEEAKKKDEQEAVKILSDTIMQYAELKAIESAVRAKVNIAYKLMHGGGL